MRRSIYSQKVTKTRFLNFKLL